MNTEKLLKAFQAHQIKVKYYPTFDILKQFSDIDSENIDVALIGDHETIKGAVIYGNTTKNTIIEILAEGNPTYQYTPQKDAIKPPEIGNLIAKVFGYDTKKLPKPSFFDANKKKKKRKAQKQARRKNR